VNRIGRRTLLATLLIAALGFGWALSCKTSHPATIVPCFVSFVTAIGLHRLAGIRFFTGGSFCSFIPLSAASPDSNRQDRNQDLFHFGNMRSQPKVFQCVRLSEQKLISGSDTGHHSFEPVIRQCPAMTQGSPLVRGWRFGLAG